MTHAEEEVFCGNGPLELVEVELFNGLRAVGHGFRLHEHCIGGLRGWRILGHDGDWDMMLCCESWGASAWQAIIYGFAFFYIVSMARDGEVASLEIGTVQSTWYPHLSHVVEFFCSSTSGAKE